MVYRLIMVAIVAGMQLPEYLKRQEIDEST